MTGGTLITSGITGAAGAAFNLGGGTLQASANFELTLPLAITGIGGNSNIDTAGHWIAIENGLSGTGGLNKMGGGDLLIQTPLDYSGDTTVNGGIMAISDGITAGGTSFIDVTSGKLCLWITGVNKPDLNINTAASATFEVISGSHEVGNVSGAGATQVDSGATLTAESIVQETLTIGSGAEVIIRPLPGGPLSGKITQVPEPSTLALLAGALIILAVYWGRKGKSIFFVAWILIVMTVSSLEGAIKTWNVSYPNSGDWSKDSNWTGHLPVVTDIALIDNDGTANVTSNGDICDDLQLYNGNIQMTGGTFSAYSVEIGGQYGEWGYLGNGFFNQSVGTNTVTHFMSLGFTGNTGTYRLSGTGILTVGVWIYIGGDPLSSARGRFEWYANGLTTPTINMNSYGTLAMGFDFNVADLISGALFHGSQLNGLNSGGLEISNNATATHAGITPMSVHVLSASNGGRYNLSGTAQLSAMQERIGESGIGILGQSGGNNTVSGELWIGFNSGATGTYELSGTGQLSAKDEYIGHLGFGSFNQNGGTNTVTDYLYVGEGNNGTYNLLSGQLSAANENIGSSNTGTFNHSAGTNTVGNLNLGLNFTGNGTYVLSGTGQLSAQYEVIGVGSAGTFNHSAGTNTIVHGLTLGSGATVTGTYNLSDTGQLSATEYESIGRDGIGVFNQSGGNNTVVGSLTLGNNASGNGTYNLTGGTLNLNNLLKGDGAATFNFGGGTMRASAPFTTAVHITLSGINGNARIDTQNFNVTISSAVAGNGGLNKLGSDILTLSDNATYLGDTIIEGGTLCLDGANPVLHAISGAGILEVGVNNTSTLTANNIQVAQIIFGINASGSATYDLHGSGLVSASNIYLGLYGAGTFNHSAGTNTVSALLLGYFSHGNGTYNLSGTGALSASNEYIGEIGAGAFNQSGGINTLTGSLFLGDSSGSGMYNLSGTGQLSATNEYVGNVGSGAFNQSGGTHTLTGSLVLGDSSGSGMYNLSGTGQLSATNEYVGNVGSGAFNQSGGTHTLSGNLYLANNSESMGMYNLIGGSLLAQNEKIGVSGAGTFNQSAGTNTITGYLSLSFNSTGSGTYNLGGTGQLSAGTEFVGDAATGVFNHSAGSNTLSNNLYLGYQSDGNGEYNLSKNGQLSAFYQIIGFNGTGVFNQYGGTNTVVGSLTLGNNHRGKGTYNFTGGTLNLNNLQKGDGAATFNFGGGTMRATTTLTATVPITLTGTNGDATVDTQNYNVTFSNPVAGDGGLKKQGAGTLTLAGNAAYLGGTTINGGLLQLNGADSVLHAITGSGNLGLGNGVTASMLTADSIQVSTLTISAYSTLTIAAIPGGPTALSDNLTSVPEPSTLALLGIGAISLLACTWRRRK
ncbi:MAG: PEP-CTERM sorting domain-containing protein [Thermoguttaceae bacterium]